jgi:N-terminal domain of unknown function (DUF4140)
MKTQIDTSISHVTVHTDRATVTRQSVITLDGSETQLVIDRLPKNIQQDSIRVSGRSDSEVKILSVNTNLQRFTQPDRLCLPSQNSELAINDYPRPPFGANPPQP